MSTTEEATVNPDGSTEFKTSPGEDETFNTTDQAGDDFGEQAEAVVVGTDPAIYLLLFVVLLAAVYFFMYYRRKKSPGDSFFDDLDGEKFNIKLPEAVDDYYVIKEKCLAAGWEPGKGPSGGAGQQSNGPHRVMAQALMKRCIADIPLVTHIQKEAAGMNRLYSQSMCSVKQWKSFQAAEALVSEEVQEVREEADEIEPGWSQVIWRQAMQYHNMLKQKHEMEAKAASEQANKRKEVEDKVKAEKRKIEEEKARELAAEKAAQELIKAEEREKQSKKSFNSKGMKKGFLNSGAKKK